MSIGFRYLLKKLISKNNVSELGMKGFCFRLPNFQEIDMLTSYAAMHLISGVLDCVNSCWPNKAKGIIV